MCGITITTVKVYQRCWASIPCQDREGKVLIIQDEASQSSQPIVLQLWVSLHSIKWEMRSLMTQEALRAQTFLVASRS